MAIAANVYVDIFRKQIPRFAGNDKLLCSRDDRQRRDASSLSLNQSDRVSVIAILQESLPQAPTRASWGAACCAPTKTLLHEKRKRRLEGGAAKHRRSEGGRYHS